jgi:hypothetical protein
MRAGRHVRFSVALLSMLALVGKVLAGAFCHAPAVQAGAGGNGIFDPVLGFISLCHSGAHTAPASGDGPQPDPGQDHCKACTLLGGLALAIALIFAAVVFPVRAIHLRLPAGLRTLADHLSFGGIRSRAPPLLA